MTKNQISNFLLLSEDSFRSRPIIPGKTVTLLAGRNISERTVTAMEGNLRCE